MSMEDTSGNSRSHGTITPIQRSHRRSPVAHSRGVSCLNTPFEGSTPEKRDSIDTVTISGIKREADLDSKSFLRKSSTPIVIAYG